MVRQAEALERERSLNALQHSLQAKDRQLQVSTAEDPHNTH